MKKIILFLGFSLVMTCVFAQVESSVDTKTTKELTKAEKKELRRLQEEETAKMVHWMVENRKFVLEANFLSNQTGQRVTVSSRINFIAIDSNKITIQLASTSGIGGANGMGGVTTDGTISQFKVTSLGKKSSGYSIQVLSQTPLGNYDIFFSVSPNGNSDATIGGSWGGKLNYHGYLVPLGVSKVYKGMAI